MQKKTQIIIVAILAVATCGVTFILWKGLPCDKTQLAINNANVLIMTQSLALSGDPQSVHILGNYDSYRKTQVFSRCGRLEKQESILGYDDFSSVKTKMTIVRQNQGKEKGWVQEGVSQGRHGTVIISSRHFYTDDQGRIIRMKGKTTVNGETREQNSWRYDYDDANRLLRETISDDETSQRYVTEFHYAANGRLIGTTAPLRTQTLRWDEKGRWRSTEVIREMGERGNWVRQSTCETWDGMGNCTLSRMVETSGSIKNGKAEMSERMRLNTQIQYRD